MHVHLPAYVSDEGLPAWAGAAAMSLIGAGNVLGTLLSGHLAAKYAARRGRVLAAIYLSRSALFAATVLLPASTAWLLLFALALGVLMIATSPLTAAIVDGLFGPEYGSTLMCVAFAGHQTGAFAGAWLGGRVYDRFGSYDPMWLVCVALGVLAAADHWTISGVPAHAHAGDMETRAACATMATKPEPPSPEAFELVEPRAHGGASGVG